MTSCNIYKEYNGGDLVVSRTMSGNDGRNQENNCTSSTLRVVKQRSSQQDWSVAKGIWDNSLAAPTWRILASGPTMVGVPANQEQALLSRLTEAVRGHSFNAAIFLGESRESIATILRTSRAVLGAFNRLRHGDIAGCARYLGAMPGQRGLKAMQKRYDAGDISGTWLSLKYGWVPLVADCYEAAQAFQKQNERRRTVFRVSTVYKAPRRNIAQDSFYKIWMDEVAHLRIKCTVTENPSTMRALGLLNPLSLAWELLPFSFIVDWFAPIGDWLDNWSFLGSLSATFVRSDWRKSTASFFPTSPVYPSPTTRYLGGGYSHEKMTFSRQVGPIATVPTPSLKDLSRICSFGHIANAAALMHQMVSQSRKPVVTKRFKPGELAGYWAPRAGTN